MLEIVSALCNRWERVEVFAIGGGQSNWSKWLSGQVLSGQEGVHAIEPCIDTLLCAPGAGNQSWPAPGWRRCTPSGGRPVQSSPAKCWWAWSCGLSRLDHVLEPRTHCGRKRWTPTCTAGATPSGRWPMQSPMTRRSWAIKPLPSG